MRGKHSPRPTRPLRDFHGIYTVAPQMSALFERLPRVARSGASVLIRGETGTGKELVARALHLLSPRKKGRFEALNCATLTAELLASELFGHVRGAFTGAIRDRPGLFRQAHRGTIFLDEIAEMPLEIQARLLRVLQERSFTPLGGTDPVEVDVRVVSATHRSLREECRQHRFREDLMYRVRVVPLFLPPLAERTGDVEALTWHFIDHYAAQGPRRIERIERSVMDALLAYPWPGNIRELRNAVEYAHAIGEGPDYTLDDLTPELRGEPPPRVLPPALASTGPAITPPDDDPERARIRDALQRSGGRKGDAALLLGLSRSTLWRRLRELRLA
ncbi:MAG: sigma-54-dependent Fis family transcriptional regulator [Myxococcales bacterium]|nr:sigma-54-dependent Fis family transcriptional regulator [Myxococcales bacterium]